MGGASANAQAIAAICKALRIPVQLGGGVRDLDGLARALDLGVDRVILGTLAAKDPELALTAAVRWPGRVVIGIDARDGMVAVQGWTESSNLHFVDLAKRFDVVEVAAIVFTDIARDGMHSGPSLDSTRRLCENVSRPIIAAGGVHDLDDVRRLKALAPLGLIGFITDRAIYEGTLDLCQAIALAGAA